jgi:threonine/homoserine/homoserine lactone efflux protein
LAAVHELGAGASEPAFLAHRLAGAAYLVFLGAESLVRAARSRGRRTPLPGRSRTELPLRTAYRQGLVGNLGNPKMAVFFTSLLPQFAPAGHAAFAVMLLLGFTFCLLTFGWLSAYAVAVAKAGVLLARPRARPLLDALTGAALVAFGGRLASEAQ